MVNGMSSAKSEFERCYEEKAGQLINVIWIIYKKYGNEGLEPIKKYFFEYGVKLGKQVRKKVDGDLRNFVPTLASFFAGASLFTMNDPHVKEKRVIEYQESGCPLVLLARKHSVREDIICDVFNEIDRGIAEGAGLKMTCDQAFSRGKPYEVFRWELP